MARERSGWQKNYFMTKKFKTSQENLWAGKFGDKYNERNSDADLLADRLSMFVKILESTQGVSSVLELGASIGLNLRILQRILPKAKLSGLDINATAVRELKKIRGVKAYQGSILDFEVKEQFDFVFTRGVLIHLNPKYLPKVYEKLFASSRKYICLAEYYNPSPVTVPYHGLKDKLFKRDFAGEMLDLYPDLKLVSYGFAYHRDNNYPQDDVTWFLLEKR